jgi:hypothetical protein
MGNERSSEEANKNLALTFRSHRDKGGQRTWGDARRYSALHGSNAVRR